jgi:hypothetical protein
MNAIKVEAALNEHGKPAVLFIGPFKTAWKAYRTLEGAKRAVETTWTDPDKVRRFWLDA